ncbi:hypothetical protein Salat_1011500 [Sesamum alatum]|uniref:Uncharacterized protein n=1 Tax=Sesamum alatum TaxID=300844 RepID=A0AAE1YLB9_9LAMI|nr:hypothetical protein Salat_1011500 [Sesamum alatum]
MVPLRIERCKVGGRILCRVRAGEANGYVFYTRNKRFKRRSEGVSITEASSNGGEEFEMKEDEVAKIDGRPGFTRLGGMERAKLVASALQKLLNAGAKKLPDSSSDTLKKKLQGNNSVADVGFDVRWRLLKGITVQRKIEHCCDKPWI